VGETIRLAAVQARWDAAGYATPAAFRAQVQVAMRTALAGAPGPALVAFPELYAAPLLFTVGGGGPALDRSLAAALRLAARGRLRRWLAALLRGSTPLQAVAGDLGVAAFVLWFEVMAEAARSHRATVIAGSGLFPQVGYEAARGWHVCDRQVENVALVFGPSGALIARPAKVFLTPGLERRIGLKRGDLAALPVVETPVGRVGVAVCLDGWFHPVLEHLDGRGAEIVVQPSANPASWTRRWPPDPAIDEGQAWLERGLALGLRGRHALRYGVNPMLVGGTAPLAFEGRSSLWRRSPSPVEPAELLAIAPAASEPAVVYADVAHPRTLAGAATC